MTKEEKRIYDREWRKKNPEKQKAYDKKYKLSNSDKVRERKKKWRSANRDKVLEAKRKWEAKNREKINAQMREYRKKPERINKYMARKLLYYYRYFRLKGYSPKNARNSAILWAGIRYQKINHFTYWIKI